MSTNEQSRHATRITRPSNESWSDTHVHQREQLRRLERMGV
jgi:hypothetical protein